MLGQAPVGASLGHEDSKWSGEVHRGSGVGQPEASVEDVVGGQELRVEKRVREPCAGKQSAAQGSATCRLVQAA